VILKNVVMEDCTNYCKTNMFLIFPHCTFKCDKECGMKLCQNSSLINLPNIEISTDNLVRKYINNSITHAIVCGGLEPFDSFDDLLELVEKLRTEYDCNDDIVVYTGYNKEEIVDKITKLKNFNNIVIKYGRFIPNQKPHLDPILKIYLASDNQYAEKL